MNGSLTSQMTCSAIRLVAGASASAQATQQSAKRPFQFKRACAWFLIGKRGRDARFKSDGQWSLWTRTGARKHLSSQVPQDVKATLEQAVELDSLMVIERNGKVIGRVAVPLEVPEPAGILPVGIDLKETRALVAVDPNGWALFVSGKAIQVKHRRTAKTRARLQRNHAARKAQHQDARSVRRVMKRPGRKQRKRTPTFAPQPARQLVQWTPNDAALVFEELHIPRPEKGKMRGRALRRRMSLWQGTLIRTCIENKTQECGMSMAQVNPASTSNHCSRCGLRGVRKRHSFTYPPCGHSDHADINAAYNIRHRSTQVRLSELLSMSPQVQA
jgi:putative transposase